MTILKISSFLLVSPSNSAEFYNNLHVYIIYINKEITWLHILSAFIYISLIFYLN